MKLTRRRFNAALATTALVAAAGLSPFELIARAVAQDAPTPADLATPSPLGDIALGDVAVGIKNLVGVRKLNAGEGVRALG